MICSILMVKISHIFTASQKNSNVWRDVKSEFRLVIYQRKSNFTMYAISKYAFHLVWNFLHLILLRHLHWQKQRFLPHFISKMTQRHWIKFLFRYSFSVAQQLSKRIWYVDIRIGLWHYLNAGSEFLTTELTGLSLRETCTIHIYHQFLCNTVGIIDSLTSVVFYPDYQF